MGIHDAAVDGHFLQVPLRLEDSTPSGLPNEFGMAAIGSLFLQQLEGYVENLGADTLFRFDKVGVGGVLERALDLQTGSLQRTLRRCLRLLDSELHEEVLRVEYRLFRLRVL